MRVLEGYDKNCLGIPPFADSKPRDDPIEAAIEFPAELAVVEDDDAAVAPDARDRKGKRLTEADAAPTPVDVLALARSRGPRLPTPPFNPKNILS